MSLRYEQYHAIGMTREFLRDIISGKAMKVSELRKMAMACLHHYPHLYESGQPRWSKDEFTNDEGGAGQ